MKKLALIVVCALIICVLPASWDFPYSDSWFSLPSGQYHHDFARMSLGLTVSAFRDADHPDAQDVNLIAYAVFMVLVYLLMWRRIGRKKTAEQSTVPF